MASLLRTVHHIVRQASSRVLFRLMMRNRDEAQILPKSCRDDSSSLPDMSIETELMTSNIEALNLIVNLMLKIAIMLFIELREIPI